MSIQIKVSDYDDLRGHVEYSLEVRDYTGESWCFKRRYSALRFFHELLKKSEKNVPVFPPKKIFGNLNPDFLDSRKKHLDQYFAALSKIPEIVHSSAFKDFIKPFDKAPIIKNKRNNKKAITKEITDAIDAVVGKMIEEASLEFVNISQYVRPEKEDIERLEVVYAKVLEGISFGQEKFIPKAIPENVNKLKKPVCDSKGVNLIFKNLVQGFLKDNESVRLDSGSFDCRRY